MASEPTVIAGRHGRAGRITLNRPAALNSIDAAMVQDVARALAAWRDDPEVHLVVIEGAGGKAFCAGGDVRTVRERVLAGAFDQVEAFFVDEYALNRTIARYPKPYVAVIDGVCMGGGVGLSVHGAYRVVSERAMLAMPEVQIGLFPDIGASHVLPRLRGAAGFYLGLTGRRIGGADACFLGLATHFVPSARIATLTDALCRDGVAALAGHAEPPPASEFAPIAGAIDAVFARDGLEAIAAGLAEDGSAWAEAAQAAISTASPAALRRTFTLLRDGAGRTLEQCLWAELLLTREATRHPDFAEGVRAAVIDKDRKPRWLDQPAMAG